VGWEDRFNQFVPELYQRPPGFPISWQIDRQGTPWVVFEDNNERLWSRVRQTIVEFLTMQFRKGGWMGPSPMRAFFVSEFTEI
jgi:hypothetical protein